MIFLCKYKIDPYIKCIHIGIIIFYFLSMSMFNIDVSLDSITEFIKTGLPAIGVFLIWMVIHYITPRLYIYLCGPLTILGFILSPMASTMPHCKALRWLFTVSADNLNAMIVLLGTWFVSIFMHINKKKKFT